MLNKRIIYILLVSLIMPVIINAQTNKPAVDYMNVPGPVVFENKLFNLNWSTHPAANFYKQEYIVKGELADRYKTMLLMDVITGEAVVKNVVATKVAELKKMKEGNPVINYEVIQSSTTGEYMIDFLLTAHAPDGTISIVERNVYRYKTFTGKSGQTGILLFGISERGYGTGVTNFFNTLKTNRKDLINKVSKFNIPGITIKN